MSNELFDFDELNEKMIEWRGMPEFNQPNNGAHRQIIVSFEDDAGIKDFAEKLQLNITPKTKSVWYPPRMINRVTDLFYYDDTDDQHSDSENY